MLLLNVGRYADRLIASGTVDAAHVQTIVENYTRHLSDELDRAQSYQPDENYLKKQWQHIQPASNSITTWNTGVDYGVLHYVGAQSVKLPENFVRICYSYHNNTHTHAQKACLLSVHSFEISLSFAHLLV